MEAAEPYLRCLPLELHSVSVQLHLWKDMTEEKDKYHVSAITKIYKYHILFWNPAFCASFCKSKKS